MRKTTLDWTRFTRRRLTALFLGALGVLLASAFLSLSGFRDAADTARWLEHTYKVLIALEQTFSDVNAAESAARGYIITGSPDSLSDYHRFEVAASNDESAVADLTSDNPRQIGSIPALRRSTEERFAQLNQLIALRKKGPLSAKAGQGLFVGGRSSIRQIRSRIDSMESEERQLLGLRQEATYHNGMVGLAFFAISSVSGLLLLTGVYTLVLNLVASFEASRRQQEAYSRRMEQEVERTREARRELERSNRELQDFAFVASHDLQEPLRKIRAYGDRIRVRAGDSLDEAISSDLGRMQSAAERMQGLINDILSLSRVTTKGQAFVRVELNQVFDEVIDDLEARIQQTDAIVTRGDLPILDADPVQMRQLLQNLIGNALKFNRPGVRPQVRVEMGSNVSRSQVGFTVSDNGIGFDEKHTEKIFTVFQRLHSRKEYEGSGVGLAICRKIVERHGGTIVANGKPGEGATFSITLPRIQAVRSST